MAIQRKFRLLTKSGRTTYYSSVGARDRNAHRIADEIGEWVGLEFLVDGSWARVGTVKPATDSATV